MRVAPGAELARRLHELTAGNPLLLAELLSIGPPERVVGEWSSPPRIRDIVRKRTAELGRATSEILKRASLFENDFTVELLAETTGTSTGTTATLIDRAVEAHVLQPSTIHSYRFAHQLFRHALVADLSADQRADGHRRIACSLERRESSSELLAAHWSAASGPDVAPKVMAYARIAGRESLQMFEPSAAVRWFELALAYLSDDADRGSLLAELAEAQQFAGDPRCVATLQEAVSIALATNDDSLTLQIVRVTTPGWSTFPGVTGPDTQQLLARALEIVDDAATRSRILTRLAIDLSLRDSKRAERVADESVALARVSRDRTALLDCLLRRASFSLTPHSLATRRSALREVLDLSSPRHRPDNTLFRAQRECYRCDPSRRSRRSRHLRGRRRHDRRELRPRAAALELALAAGLAGRPPRSTRTGRGADRRSVRVRRGARDLACPGVGAPAACRASMAARPRCGARARRSRGLSKRTRPAFRESRSCSHECSRNITMFHDEARALLSDFAENDFASLPIGTFWSSALIVSAETATHPRTA